MSTQNLFGDLALDATVAATNTKLDAITQAEDSAHTSGDKGVPVFGVRSSTDTVTTDEDGDYTLLKIDEEGRLKVSAKPASYPDITGDITAIQATIGTPVAGGTVGGDVSRASNVMAFCTGTFSAVNCTFEGSLEASGNTNWFGIQAIRTNANTIETATGNLSAQPVYGWELSVNALKRVRVRATARTSGTQSWRFVQGTYATEPIPGAQVSATQPVSGTVTANWGTITSPLNYNLKTAATNNATFIKASAGSMYEMTLSNPTATPVYVKFYNKTTAAAPATDVPILIVPVPANSTEFKQLGTLGKRFTTGIAIAVVGGIAINDNTNAVADVLVNVTYI